jgi:hypothetical protein
MPTTLHERITTYYYMGNDYMYYTIQDSWEIAIRRENNYNSFLSFLFTFVDKRVKGERIAS